MSTTKVWVTPSGYSGNAVVNASNGLTLTSENPGTFYQTDNDTWIVHWFSYWFEPSAFYDSGSYNGAYPGIHQSSSGGITTALGTWQANLSIGNLSDYVSGNLVYPADKARTTITGYWHSEIIEAGVRGRPTPNWQQIYDNGGHSYITTNPAYPGSWYYTSNAGIQSINQSGGATYPFPSTFLYSTPYFSNIANSSNITLTASGANTTVGSSNTFVGNVPTFTSNIRFTSGQGKVRASVINNLTFNYSFTTQYELTTHIIDGVNGDSVYPMTANVTSSFTGTRILSGESAADYLIDASSSFGSFCRVGFPYTSLNTVTEGYFVDGYVDSDYTTVFAGYAHTVDPYAFVDYVEEGYYALGDTIYLSSDLAQHIPIEASTNILGGLALYGNVAASQDSLLDSTSNVTQEITLTLPVEADIYSNVEVRPSIKVSQDLFIEADIFIDAESRPSIKIDLTLANDISVTALAGIIPGVYETFTSTVDATITATNLIEIAKFYVGDFVETGYFDDIGEPLVNRIQSSIFAEGTVELIPSANLDASAAIQGTGGYLHTLGSLTLAGDGVITINPTSTGSAGVLIGSAASNIDAALDIISSPSVIVDGISELSGDGVVLVASGFLDTFAASISVDSSLYAYGEIGQFVSAEFFIQTNFNVLAGFALYGATTVDLFAMTMSVLSQGRIYTFDEYYSLKVTPEHRGLYIIPEPRVTLASDESRVNKVIPEDRSTTIDSETRTYKIPYATPELVGATIRRQE